MVIYVDFIIPNNYQDDSICKYAVNSLVDQFNRSDLFCAKIKKSKKTLDLEASITFLVLLEYNQCVEMNESADWIYLLYLPTPHEAKLLQKKFPTSRFVSCIAGTPIESCEYINWCVSHSIIPNQLSKTIFVPKQHEISIDDENLKIIRYSQKDLLNKDKATELSGNYIVIPHRSKEVLNLYVFWCLSIGSVPITDESDISHNYKELLTFRLSDIPFNDNKFPEISGDYTWSKLSKEWYKLLQQERSDSEKDKSDFVYFPLLDITHLETTDQENDIDSDDASINNNNSIQAYNTEGQRRVFYPWSLALLYHTLDKGIFVAKRTLTEFGIEVPDKQHYLSVGLMAFRDFASNTRSVCSLSERYLPVTDSQGKQFIGCPPPHLWCHSSDSHLYFEKLSYSQENAFVTYLETPDALKILRQTIANLSDCNKALDLNYSIYVYYRSDSTLIQYPDVLSSLEGFDQVEIEDICRLGKIEFSQYNSLAEELLSIYLTPAQKIIYFNPFTLWLDFPRTMFSQSYLYCFESYRGNQTNNHPEVVQWRQRNLKYLPTYNPPAISGSVVVYNRKDHWLSLLVALGMLYYPITRHITIGDALYLAQEATQSPSHIAMMGGDITELCLGRRCKGLFIGTPVYQIKDCVFYRVPPWYVYSPPNSQLLLQPQRNWYFEKRLASIVTEETGSTTLETSLPYMTRLNKMYL